MFYTYFFLYNNQLFIEVVKLHVRSVYKLLVMLTDTDQMKFPQKLLVQAPLQWEVNSEQNNNFKEETCVFTDTTFTLCGRLCTLGEWNIKMQLYFHGGLISDISRVCLTSSNFICSHPIARFPCLYIYPQSMFAYGDLMKLLYPVAVGICPRLRYSLLSENHLMSSSCLCVCLWPNISS